MATVNSKNLRRKQSSPAEFRVVVKTELIRRDSSITELAETLGKSRTAVSLAVNHSTMFPDLKKKIREHLNLASVAL